MRHLYNDTFKMAVSEQGTVESLFLIEDPEQMNWVIDSEYAEEAGYADRHKSLGQWTAQVDGETIESVNLKPHIEGLGDQAVIVNFAHPKFEVRMQYLLTDEGEWTWHIRCSNPTGEAVNVTGFHSWFSLAYIMFRDRSVLRNMNHSCAVFPHLGGDFSKFAAVRRSDTAPHLGIYSTGERVSALGTHCSYLNRFLDQVSPSLDGILYHRLSLVEDGSSMPQSAEHDWIYGDGYVSLTLEPAEEKRWSFVFAPFGDQEEFYQKAKMYGHPYWDYSPVTTTEGKFWAEVELPEHNALRAVTLFGAAGESITETDLLPKFKAVHTEKSKRLRVVVPVKSAGELKLVAEFEDGRRDVLVGNVLEPVHRIMEERARWLCEHSFNGIDGERPYASLPLSNQGESLGKLTFILMKNRLAPPEPAEVQKVELAAFFDVRDHWFEQGQFAVPTPLYGSFYRIYDFDYIGHVYYLLSKFEPPLLRYANPETYLSWAAEVMCMRLDPECHLNVREKEESQLVGVFTLYIVDLLEDLRTHDLLHLYNELNRLWVSFAAKLKQDSSRYEGAITEHFYDNAGFGLTCEALCLAGHLEEAERYAPLVTANIGFSNDYRANAPDRWWEALSYMTHSLWGGLVAGAARASYEKLEDVQLLKGGYRATMAMFNCYDWNVRSTPRLLQRGEAASTYSIAAPNLNMPELSRNRFGQSIFKHSDDPLFSHLFADVEGDDWDMGEELVAYLLGFGSTTYLYTDDEGELKCINGFIEPVDKGWEITSYAAYPTRYVMLERGLCFMSPQGELLKKIRFVNGKFKQIYAENPNTAAIEANH